MRNDEFSNKGAVEQDAPGESTNQNLRGQLGHRDQDPLIKSSDSDFPEPGNNEEHTGESRDKVSERNPHSPERDSQSEPWASSEKQSKQQEGRSAGRVKQECK